MGRSVLFIFSVLAVKEMPAAGFDALFEVAALSMALTLSCIVGSRYAARCVRSGSPSNVSALLASLLTAFFSVYGELLLCDVV